MAHIFRTIALIGTMVVLSPTQESSEMPKLDRTSLETMALATASTMTSQISSHVLEQMADKDKAALALMIGRAMIAGDKSKP